MRVIRVTSQMDLFAKPGLRVLVQLVKAPTIIRPIVREKMILNLVTALLVRRLRRQPQVVTQRADSGVSVLQKMEPLNLV